MSKKNKNLQGNWQRTKHYIQQNLCVWVSLKGGYVLFYSPLTSTISLLDIYIMRKNALDKPVTVINSNQIIFFNVSSLCINLMKYTSLLVLVTRT